MKGLRKSAQSTGSFAIARDGIHAYFSDGTTQRVLTWNARGQRIFDKHFPRRKGGRR